jgi:hypothetical protein
MVTDGTEVIIGVVQEPVFGPLVVSGLDGVATKVLSDHSAGLAPLTDAGAGDLIRSVRAAPLLPGRRGAPVGFQNSATVFDQAFYAARSYSLMRPPRTGWRLIRS